MLDNRSADGTIPLAGPDAGYPMARPGERYLFFLVPAPDGRTYGSANHSFGRLLLDGPVVTASDGRRTPVRFGNREVAPADFLRHLQETVRTQRPR